jgi:hypothetical protein
MWYDSLDGDAVRPIDEYDNSPALPVFAGGWIPQEEVARPMRYRLVVPEAQRRVDSGARTWRGMDSKFQGPGAGSYELHRPR